MAPNKLEEHIKKELEEREIQPSLDTWAKLSGKLDETVFVETKRKGYLWYAAAICLIGLIIRSISFFNTTSTLTVPNIQLVDDNQEVLEEVYDFQKSKIKSDRINEVSAESISKEKKKSSGAKVNRVVLKEENYDEQLVAVEDDIQPILFKTSEEIIDTKVLQVIAQVDILELNNESLTDAEVDSLLRNAQAEILKTKLFRSDYSVDAMALLTEVEDELDSSFKDNFFESLKAKFLKVRTAVAASNN